MRNTSSLASTLDRMVTLNRALDEAFNSGWSQAPTVWVPAIDVVEKKDKYLLYAELPGIDASQVEISFEQNVLTLRGTKQSPLDTTKEGEYRVYAAERVSGTFERSVRLPEFVDGDQITANFTNGLLTVTVPKVRAAQARRIEISSAPKAAELSSNGTHAAAEAVSN